MSSVFEACSTVQERGKPWVSAIRSDVALGVLDVESRGTCELRYEVVLFCVV